jgi:hypothetical protein
MTISITTLSIKCRVVTVSINDTQHNKALPLCIVSRSRYCHSECHYAECHYAECRYAECRYAECHYAECRYAECHYAECRGTDNLAQQDLAKFV